ncbi:hypothetical protein [Nocardia sp. NPDC004260]
MCALDATVHVRHRAIAAGQPSPLINELATHLLTAARTLHPASGKGGAAEIVEPLRQWGASSPIVHVQLERAG